MSEPVKRYSYGYHDDGFGGRHLGLIEKDGGDLVLYADYARLEQECAELSERYGKLQTGEGHITHRVIAERDAALKQVEGLRQSLKDSDAGMTLFLEQRNAALQLLAECQEHLDPHRDAALWSDVCGALGPKP